MNMTESYRKTMVVFTKRLVPMEKRKANGTATELIAAIHNSDSDKVAASEPVESEPVAPHHPDEDSEDDTDSEDADATIDEDDTSEDDDATIDDETPKQMIDYDKIITHMEDYFQIKVKPKSNLHEKRIQQHQNLKLFREEGIKNGNW